MPEFVEPELARIVDVPAGGTLWVHEIKFDGYRMQLRVAKKRAALFTRKALDWSHRFAEIVAEANALPDCILDGEVAAVDARGISNFGDLQSALSDGKTGELLYFVFDLLYLEGHDLRGVPLTQRKALLEELLSTTPAALVALPVCRALPILRQGDAGCRLPDGTGRHHLQARRCAVQIRTRQ